MSASPTVVMVPGLRDHVPDHWQTLLAERLPRCVTVPRLPREKMSCAAWVQALDDCVSRVHGDIVLAAHSAGVMMVVHWAQRPRRPIRGALLAAPPDFEVPLPEGYPSMALLRQGGWLPTPRERLPFPSIVAASTNDPLASFYRVVALAAAWGSRLQNVGAAGHLNPASGHGEWPLAQALIAELCGELVS